MSLRLSAVSSLVVSVLAVLPAAAIRSAPDAMAAAASADRGNPRLLAMSGVPSSVAAGGAVRVRGRVARLPGRVAKAREWLQRAVTAAVRNDVKGYAGVWSGADALREALFGDVEEPPAGACRTRLRR